LLDELLLEFEFSHHSGSLVRVVFTLDGSTEFLGFIIQLLLLDVGFDFNFFLNSMVSHLELFVLLHEELSLVNINVFSFLLGQLGVEVLILGAGLVGDTLHARKDSLVD